jgi:hypothetical protein
MNQQDLDREDKAFRARHPEIKFEDIGPTPCQFWAGILALIAFGSAIMRWIAIKIFRRK